MKFSPVFLFTCIVIAILSESTCQVKGKPMQQEPLVFGRRGYSRPKSSMFFGKRSDSGLNSFLEINQIKQACNLLMGYIDSIEAPPTAEIDLGASQQE